jgi:putative transposase
MSWKECCVVDERLRFVARVLEGEQMAALCREFGISRKTGYKIFNRYKDCGIEGLLDRTRRPIRFGNQLPFQVEQAIVSLKKEKLSFGARKIRELLRRKYPDIPLPAVSTVHAVLDRNDLVRKKDDDDEEIGQPARSSQKLFTQMISGVLITKDSFSWATTDTVTHLPSLTMQPDTLTPVKVSNQQEKSTPLRPLKEYLRSLVCRVVSKQITVCPSHLQTHCLT